MTSGNQSGSGSEFDIVAAASEIAAQAIPIDGAVAEEAAKRSENHEEQLRVAAILRQHGIDLGLAEGEAIDNKLIATGAKLDRLRRRQEEAQATQFTDEDSPEAEIMRRFAPTLIRRAQREVDILSLAQLISVCNGSQDAETDREMSLDTVLVIVNSDNLTPAEREGFLNTVEEFVGAETFAEIIREIGTGDALEQHVVEELVYNAAAKAQAAQLLEIQQVLIDEFGLNSVGHEDWQAFSRSIQKLMRMADGGVSGTLWQAKLANTLGRARRLGIDEATFESMLGRFGIARQ